MDHMTSSAPQKQRNALAPALLAAIALVVSPLFTEGFGVLVILFLVAILAVIVAWFAWQAGQWWWTIVFAAVAVIWNPIFPFGFSGPVWVAAQIVAAVTFIAAGAMIKNERTAP
ncbi:hypothetical protein GCM10007269_34020 [Microbacterium murale]|uniref:Uncharacterized protein n=2 Tax=Microbacterium murale TaxID=1081040 RepID=A0ABQ1S0Q7_9MICO|nr:hypothetical protein GCM10007269_34020 [Microbacterium murale]